MPEIRCDNKFHCEVSDNSIGILIKTCDSRFCKTLNEDGSRRNEIVEHRWNLEKVSEDGTIRPIDTKRLKRPEVRGI